MSEKKGSSFEEIGAEIGRLVKAKDAAYGSAVAKSGDFMRVLYPRGVQPEHLGDLAAVVRIVDKLFRIATAPGAFGEDPWADISGYALVKVKQGRRGIIGGRSLAPMAASEVHEDWRMIKVGEVIGRGGPAGARHINVRGLPTMKAAGPLYVRFGAGWYALQGEHQVQHGVVTEIEVSELVYAEAPSLGEVVIREQNTFSAGQVLAQEMIETCGGAKRRGGEDAERRALEAEAKLDAAAVRAVDAAAKFTEGAVLGVQLHGLERAIREAVHGGLDPYHAGALARLQRDVEAADTRTGRAKQEAEVLRAELEKQRKEQTELLMVLNALIAAVMTQANALGNGGGTGHVIAALGEAALKARSGIAAAELSTGTPSES